MPQWVDSFENHPVHQQLQAFHKVLNRMRVDLTQDPSPETTEYIERFRQIGNYAQKVFSSLGPFLVPTGVLDNINAQVQQAIQYCNHYQADKSITHLSNANHQIEGTLMQLGSLLVIQNGEELEGLSEGIVSFRRSVGQYHRYVADEHRGLRAEIESAKQGLETLSTNIGAQQARLDEVVSAFQRQFSESEERRRSEFAESEKSYETRFRELQEKWGSELSSFIEDQSAQSEHHLDQITTHKARAEELIHVIANTGMVGGYQRIANDARKAAFVWRLTTVIALVCLILFAIFAFAATLGQSVSWQAFSARIFVATAFGILAAYAARQADRHGAVEHSNRRLELALASVDPYLVSLPEDQQHKVKQELAMKFFGEMPEVNQAVDETNGNNTDLLRTALQTISDLSKRPPGSP